MSHCIRNFFRKRKERKDAAFLENVRNKIATADNDALIEMNQDFYHSMEADRKIGYIEPEPVVKKAYEMICEEMCKRSLKTCDEIEEDIWLSKTGRLYLNQKQEVSLWHTRSDLTTRHPSRMYENIPARSSRDLAEEPAPD